MYMVNYVNGVYIPYEGLPTEAPLICEKGEYADNGNKFERFIYSNHMLYEVEYSKDSGEKKITSEELDEAEFKEYLDYYSINK